MLPWLYLKLNVLIGLTPDKYPNNSMFDVPFVYLFTQADKSLHLLIEHWLVLFNA